MDNIKKIKLSIDFRETKLIEHFNKFNFVEIKTLDLGDLIFFYDDKPILIVERKTINDLSSSIIDGRYREQKARLVKSNCNIAYLIEGNLMYHKFKSTLIGAISNLTFRDNIKVIRTISIKESIETIEKLVKKFEKGDFEQKNDNIKNYRIKKKDCYKVKDCFKLQLNLIPKVSLNMAKVLSNKYENMNNLIIFFKEHGKEGLKDIEYPTNGTKTRKVGKKNSATIYSFIIDKSI